MPPCLEEGLNSQLLEKPNNDEEECLDWGDVPEAQGPACAFVPRPKKDKGSEPAAASAAKDPGLIGALVSIAISLPALVGSWCWPLLLAGLMGVAASAGAKAFAHSISFGITLAILTNLSQFVFHGAKRRKKKGASHWQVYGPFYLTAIAVPLVMADLTRHVLQDSGLWNGPSSHMYKPTARCQATDPPPSGCLSATGIIFTILFTYSGFTCLIIGSLWSADLHKKLAAAWKLARG